MKKLSVLILALIATCCVACTGNVQQVPPIDSPLPWQCDSDFLSETTRYDVVKYFVGSDDMKYEVTDENSFLEYKISEVQDGNRACYSLDTRFVINYVQNDDYEFSGCTDEIISNAVFDKNTLYAVRTSKETKLETTPELSYKFEVDYGARTAVYDSGDTHIEKTVPEGDYIDNEYLYYYIRCFKGLSENFDMAFNVINWYSCFKRNSVATTTVRARFVGKENIVVPSELLTHFADDAKDTSDDASNLRSDTMLVSPTATAKTGQPIRVSYASGAYVSGDDQDPLYNSRLISKMIVFEYALPDTLTYTTEYTLSDVSVLLH